MLEQQPREAVDAPSIPGGVQGQVGWGPEQPGQVLDMEVDGSTGKGLELDDRFQPKTFYDSRIQCFYDSIQ